MQLGSLLSLDLEITKDNKRLLHMGAVLLRSNDTEAKADVRSNADQALARLTELAAHADFVLGHNVLHHDLPWLQQHSNKPDLALFRRPVIDTLFLNPLAFPKNPYHRLVKDYKLVKDSFNDPVADARLALGVFKDQLAAFEQQYQAMPELIELYRYLFSSSQETAGLAKVFDFVVTEPSDLSPELLIEVVADGKACAFNLLKLIDGFKAGYIDGLSLAYALAWLQVSGGNSVLPPWVWRKFPRVKTLIHQLRNQHCGNDSCQYCRDNFDARAYLNRFFELPDFRPMPDGTPLQKQIVDAGILGTPLLGVLPTGGGKSLCFQLPALVRNMRNASLTVVISPLQALMKDQVDNLKQKVGVENVAALYGMLTMPERSMILEQIRMGDIAILYVSPEQLRNKTVKQVILSRQVGAWVFDEAHCLSKWGHDFRPDYMHCAKVIANVAKEQQESPAPVFCYTATAKLDVIKDIVGHFKQQLNFDLTLFQGGVARDNLSYEVVETPVHNKLSQILRLLEDYFGEDRPGSCVIYCASRRQVEELAAMLEGSQSLTVAYFHAGLEAPVKREVLESFIAGHYRVIVATNAFGMGIDKEDVRLVIHFDIPGSLENYLQEAGRAGRDRAPANCVLLFDRQDIEQQFKLTKQNEVRLKDISALLRELRYRGKYADGKVIATSKELLRSDALDTSIDVEEQGAETKVKTAIAWLERSGFLSREDNVNSVFQGKPLFGSLDEAKAKLASLDLHPSALRRWELVLAALLNADPDEGINADDILDAVIPQIKSEQDKRELTPDVIMKTLAQMADCGLVSKGFSMTAFICPKGKENSRRQFKDITEIERLLLSKLPELAPAIDSEEMQCVDLQLLNSFIKKETDKKCSTRVLRQIFSAWRDDGKTSGQGGSIDFKTSSKDIFAVRVNRSWHKIEQIAQQRQNFTQKVLEMLYACLPDALASSQKRVMVEFSLEEMIANLKLDTTIASLIGGKSPIDQQEFLLKGIQRALLFLDAQKCIELQNGMAVFKQAMEIKVSLDNKERYQKVHYRQLDDYYHQKVVQVHVMYEYARIALEEVKLALRLVQDYFDELNESFIAKYFARRKAFLDRATSQESWNEIVTHLNNKHQEAIVHAKSEENQLILAGPGAGKTKVIIHRIAYLVRVEQVRASKILVLTFSHNAAVSLHKRLFGLLGKDAAYVQVRTFHGLALRLLGQSFEPEMLQEKNFNTLIEDAIKLLKGEVTELGLDEHHQRASMLEGIEHLLVDEYQDIDQLQYDFIAALVGKNLGEGEADEKLSLVAVGDDDQSIYGFRDANVRYIQQFKDDYQATVRYLTKNYRSTKYIIEAANSLIQHNCDRMKSDKPIEIDPSREIENAGGRMAAIDPVHGGKIKVVQCLQAAQQANEVLKQIRAIREKDTQARYEDIAVVARNGIEKHELALVRSLLHQHNIPYQFARDKEDSFDLCSVREFVAFKDFLRSAPQAMLSIAALFQWLPPEKNYWHRVLEGLFQNWQAHFGDERVVVAYIEREFNDYLMEQRRQTRFGSGVLLSTVHGVKGEEYQYVLVLDGSWAVAGLPQAKVEEERRLYYVAMTRAIDQLILFSRQDETNPHIPLISGDLTSLCFSEAERACTQVYRFTTTGFGRLYLSYVSLFPADHPAHALLCALNPGDEVRLASAGNSVFITYQGINIAKIAKKYSEEFAAICTQNNYRAAIVAMQRHRYDADNEFEQKVQVEAWWLPVIEVVYCAQ